VIIIKNIIKYVVVSCVVLGLLFAGFNHFFQNKSSKNTTIIQTSHQQSNKSELLNVIRIVDGDTIVVKIGSKNEKVRFIGVDTPESVRPDTPVEKYAAEAKAFTKKMLEGKNVRLEFDVQKRDIYARLLAYVYIEDGRMLNKLLAEEGYAQVMTVPPNVKYQQDFIRLERKARESKKGLWNSSPTPLLK